MKDLHDEGTIREASFVLLQFVTALKSLQARGIEESASSLNNVVLCREDKDAYYRLYLLQGWVNASKQRWLARNRLAHCSITFDRLNVETNEEREEERVSLCQCALVALQQLNLVSRLPLIRELLMREKAVTLSQVNVLRRDFEPVFPRTEITLKINPLSVLEYIYCADNLAYWRERGYRITYV